MSEASPESRGSSCSDFAESASADHAPRSTASRAANAAVRAGASFIGQRAQRRPEWPPVRSFIASVPGRRAILRKAQGECEMSLADKTCLPCKGGVPPLAGEALDDLRSQTPEWEVVNGHHLHPVFRFPDFITALGFVNRAGAIPETQGHHPDLLLASDTPEVTIWPHQ